MSKTKVNGSGASPVFDFLKVRSSRAGSCGTLQYVVSPDGEHVRCFPTNKTPAELVSTIEKFLAGDYGK